MKKFKKYSLLAIALSMLIIGSAANVTAAPPGGTIWTNDDINNAGDRVFEFSPGDNVYIFWETSEPDTTTWTIELKATDLFTATIATLATGKTESQQPVIWIAGDNNGDGVFDGTDNFIPNTRYYFVLIKEGDATCQINSEVIAVSSAFVVPEFLLGTLAALGAAFAAFAIVKIKKRP
jgi:hypothetical protein